MMTGIKSAIRGIMLNFSPSHEPNFIVVGAQKSGTSSLHSWLNQHPNLAGSRPKELHYFDKWINHGYSLTWYENHFKSLSFTKSKLYFESSPNYIYYEDVAQKISQFYPAIKLILVLRDPVARAISAYNMYKKIFFKSKESWKIREGKYPGDENSIYKYLFKNRDSFPSLSAVIELEIKLMNSNESKEPAILRRGIYHEQIEKYYKYFDKTQLLIMGFRALVDNPETSLKLIFSFLGVKDYPIAKFNIQAKNVGNYQLRISENDKRRLEAFYKPYNKMLFDLLNKKINW